MAKFKIVHPGEYTISGDVQEQSDNYVYIILYNQT